MSKWAAAAFRGVHELRFHLCSESAASQPLRSFLQSNYKSMKGASPALPMLVREHKGASPTVYVRYGMGKEKSVSVADMSEEQIATTLKAAFQASK
mmetsp:Transcript_909/g.3292  ORF Transcript_909/g.3292 Transcript_909/m.3292 type:complete len:96 (+) Transcript_909:143-430(+)